MHQNRSRRAPGGKRRSHDSGELHRITSGAAAVDACLDAESCHSVRVWQCDVSRVRTGPRGENRWGTTPYERRQPHGKKNQAYSLGHYRDPSRKLNCSTGRGFCKFKHHDFGCSKFEIPHSDLKAWAFGRNGRCEIPTRSKPAHRSGSSQKCWYEDNHPLHET